MKQRKNHDDASGYQGPTGLRQDGREGTFPVSLSPFSFFFVSVFFFAPTRGVLATRACSRT